MIHEVKFEEDNFVRPQILETNIPSGLIGLVMKMGLADTPEKANYVLAGVFVATLIATIVIFIFFSEISFSKPAGPDQATLERMMQNMHP
ncbi:MAG: hypothetical protein HY507_00135 [Candidatus Zambryskibacteria bacterium]|nr:hypothetical protein [Candidatus Zambryskibacteria bacterium]